MNNGWMGVPYQVPTHKEPAVAPWSLDGITFVLVFSISALLLLILGVAHYADRRNPARDKAAYKIKNAKVPAYVLTSKENMKLWLKIHFGVEPQPWQIELLEGLRDARAAAYRRANVGKGKVGYDIMMKHGVDDEEG